MMILNKPKLLVVAWEYYSMHNANVSIIERLCVHLSEYYDITISSQNVGNKQIKRMSNLNVFSVPFHSLHKSLNTANNNFFDICSMIFYKIKNFIAHDIYEKDVHFFVDELIAIVDVSKFDLILSVSFPFSDHWISSILSEKFDIPWIAYYLDPYFSNVTLPATRVKRRKKMEQTLLSTASKILITYPTNENYLHLNVSFAEKVTMTEMPGIVNEKYEDADIVVHDNCYCYFIGNLYKDIRNPESVIKIFSLLEDTIKLYFVGGWYGDSVDVEKYSAPNVQYLGSKKEEEIPDIYHDADILVNIGNLVDNQMPSKIFEYISTGKPILNIYKIPNCPTLRYLSRYPLALNIFEDDLVNDMDLYAAKIQDFCLENKGKRVPLEFIMENYQANTDEKVAEFLREQIDEVLEGNLR